MSKEENMSDIERSAKTVQITGRVSQAVKDEFEQLKESGGYETFSLFMEALLERYNNPLKINKDYETKIRDLENKNAELNKVIEDLNQKISSEMSVNQAQQLENRKLAEQVEDLSRVNLQQAGRLDELDGLQHKMDGHILVPVNDLDMRCLEWLAARENRQRKREDITPSVFFQYAVREMLIKGNKFAIDSVPDSVIATFKKEIEHGQ